MKPFILFIPLVLLAGCASSQGLKDRKAPCDGAKTAYVGENPCNPLPINVSQLILPSNKKAV